MNGETDASEDNNGVSKNPTMAVHVLSSVYVEGDMTVNVFTGTERNNGRARRTNSSPMCGLIFDLVGETVWLVLLMWRCFELSSYHLSFLFLIPYFISWGLLFLLATPSTQYANDVKGSGLMKLLFWIALFIFRKLVRLVRYCVHGTKLEAAYKTDISDDAAKNWETYLNECNEDRLVHIQYVGVAMLSVYFTAADKIDESVGWMDCSMDDASTLAIIIWCWLMTSATAWSYENRCHQYIGTLHSEPGDYPTLSCIDGPLLFLCHAARVGWIQHFLTFFLLLEPWFAFTVVVFRTVYDVGFHLILQLFGIAQLPGPLRSPNFKEVLYPDHLVFTSPTTLTCSFNFVLPRIKFWFVVKDLVPMVIGQVGLSMYAALTDSQPVSEMEYYCRVEEVVQSAVLNTSSPVLQAEPDLAERTILVEVPKFFLPWDIVGGALFFIYAMLVVIYCIIAHKWVQRSFDFPNDDVDDAQESWEDTRSKPIRERRESSDGSESDDEVVVQGIQG